MMAGFQIYAVLLSVCLIALRERGKWCVIVRLIV